MATRAVSTTVTYRAWDTSANAGKTGDSANHTLKWIKDGTASSTTNPPSEVDSTNAPGIYKVVLTSTETDCTFGALAGKSSTANIAIFGVQVGFEYVPTSSTTFGAFIGNATAAISVDASGRLDVIKVNGTSQTARDLGGQLDATVSSRATVAGIWQDTTAGDFTVALSVGKSIMNGVALGTGLTVNDITTKTGYSLTQTFPTNFSSLSIDGSGRVDVIKVNGTSQTARDLGASVLLSSGTGTGQIVLTSGTVTVGTNNDKTGYTASTVSDKTGYALTAAYDLAKTAAQTGDAMALTSSERNSTADALLTRNVSGGSSTGRTVKQALHFLRNKWSISTGTLTVYDTDDSTSSWTATVTTDGTAQPIITNDPS